ncbi:MAG: hypothetical protein R3C20_23275 [Planctomycetaceae bacterium]
MRTHPSVFVRMLIAAATLAVACRPQPVAAQNAELDHAAPATTSVAAAVLDLRKLKLPREAEPVSEPRLASVHYHQQADVKTAFSHVKTQLISLGCEEIPGGYETEQYCATTFQKQQFRISVMVLPHSQPDQVSVNVSNHGNIDLTALPKPKDTTLQFSNAAMAMYEVPGSQEKIRQEVMGAMTNQKWLPYGTAGDQMFFRQNAIVASVNCITAPAQDNKILLQYASQLVSAEIPLPPNASNAHYADVTRELSFSTTDDVNAVGKFYQNSLAADGWEPTTEAPLAIDFEFVQIFRRRDGQQMRLLMKDIKDEGRRDVRMKLWMDKVEQ